MLREFKNVKYLFVGIYGVHKQKTQQEYFGHLYNSVKHLIVTSENDSIDDVQKKIRKKLGKICTYMYVVNQM